MSAFVPYEGLHVSMMSKRGAIAWDRFVRRVPEDVGLGWRSYTVLVKSHGATSYKAFHTVKDFRRWLGEAFAVDLDGKRLGESSEAWPWRCRTGRIVATKGGK